MFNEQKGPNETKRKKPTIKRTPQNEFRFQAYKYMCAKGNVQPERLPPTEGAVYVLIFK